MSSASPPNQPSVPETWRLPVHMQFSLWLVPEIQKSYTIYPPIAVKFLGLSSEQLENHYAVATLHESSSQHPLEFFSSPLLGKVRSSIYSLPDTPFGPGIVYCYFPDLSIQLNGNYYFLIRLWKKNEEPGDDICVTQLRTTEIVVKDESNYSRELGKIAIIPSSVRRS